MALLQINRNPSPKDLRWFGALWFPAFWLLLATMVWWKSGALGVPAILATIGVALGVMACVAPGFGRRLWIGWMTLFFPIGFVVSHVLLACVYYLVFTPTGLLLRLVGRDAMRRRFDRSAPTYWEESHREVPAERVFRQF